MPADATVLEEIAIRMPADAQKVAALRRLLAERLAPTRRKTKAELVAMLEDALEKLKARRSTDQREADDGR